MKGLKAWDKVNSKRKGGTSSSQAPKRSKTRYGDPDFMVSGIDGGIIMAHSSHPGARPDILWPARIMHHNESKRLYKSGKKKETTHSVDLVFFCPYWGLPSGTNHVSKNGWDYPASSIFEMENVDASPKSIQPYEAQAPLSTTQLRLQFSLTGLSKTFFPR